MNTPFETLVRDATREALTEDERERMRTLLTEYAAFRPVRSLEPARSAGVLAWWLSRPAFALASAFLVLLTSLGGTTYAAEGALPGDLLYPVKVGVTEPVVTALTPAGKAQVTWQVMIAKRRLNEAAELSEEGRLATSTEATLVAQAADATLRGAVGASLLGATATASASTTATLDEASHFIEEGRDRLKRHDTTGATRAFRASIHAAVGLEALTQTTGDFGADDRDFEEASSSVDVNADNESSSTTDVSPEDGGASVIEGVLHLQKDQVDSKRKGDDE